MQHVQGNRPLKVIESLSLSHLARQSPLSLFDICARQFCPSSISIRRLTILFPLLMTVYSLQQHCQTHAPQKSYQAKSKMCIREIIVVTFAALMRGLCPAGVMLEPSLEQTCLF
jgi:hypothetical protein